MSRFYDALREVSRSQPVQPPQPTEDAPPDPVYLDFDKGKPAPPIPFTPKPETVKAPTAPVFQPEMDVTPEELLDRAFQPENGSGSRSAPGTNARIALDQRARLLPNATGAIGEHYRRLRTKILQQHQAKPFRTVLIASSAPQEGKTITTVNLGLSFAMIPDFRVLVIDGDLRRGTIGNWLGLRDDRVGFSDLVAGTASLDDVIVRCDDTTTAHFIVRGNSSLPPAELLHLPRLGSVLRQMAELFDLVLIDSAPLNLVTDTQLLANHCDAVILTARAFHTNRKSLEQAARELSGFRIIGTVLNGGARPKAYYYNYKIPSMVSP
jgi:capsular exopolysaccharide synthesis family protein